MKEVSVIKACYRHDKTPSHYPWILIKAIDVEGHITIDEAMRIIINKLNINNHHVIRIEVNHLFEFTLSKED